MRRFCYWSVCDGPYASAMERCVASARTAGVESEFHVMTDRPIAGCECYDCYTFEKDAGLYDLHYLKVGMTRLNFEYCVWLDADSVFLRRPDDVLAPLRRSPVHVPLELDLSGVATGAEWRGVRLSELCEVMRAEGIVNTPYLGGSSFWIVHHDAIDTVYELALGFWHKARAAGLPVDVSAGLGYAMQMLCADPDAHRIDDNPELWVHEYDGRPLRPASEAASWMWRHPLSDRAVMVRPAIVYRPGLFSGMEPPSVSGEDIARGDPSRSIESTSERSLGRSPKSS